LQALAVHASIDTTRVYLHLTNDWLAGEYLKAQKRIDADLSAVTR
jgi:site-specific recombinase XerC